MKKLLLVPILLLMLLPAASTQAVEIPDSCSALFTHSGGINHPGHVYICMIEFLAYNGWMDGWDSGDDWGDDW